MQLTDKTLQELLVKSGHLKGAVDGIFGLQSKTALNNFLNDNKINFTGWDTDRRKVAAGQKFAELNGINVGTVDGIAGKVTVAAFIELNQKLGKASSAPAPVSSEKSNVWPLQKDCERYYGKVGTNQTSLTLPYKMRLAWDLKSSVIKFQCHEKVHDAMSNIFTKTLSEYGEEKIKQLRLDVFGGCLNVRQMRGGSAWSMHSWGIAVDLDPENNGLKMNHKQATFAKPEYVPFWKIVESEGAVSLGRARDFDWMHFQFARL